MNIPNSITVFRILLTIPIFVLISLSNWTWALALFAVASFTDYIDGLIARRLNLITNTGKVLDQIADKVLISSVMIALIPFGYIPAWLVALIISRDSVVSAFRILASSKGKVVQANMWGKIKTVTQIILVILILISQAFVFDAKLLTILFVHICAVFTVISGAVYVVQNKRFLGG